MTRSGILKLPVQVSKSNPSSDTDVAESVDLLAAHVSVSMTRKAITKDKPDVCVSGMPCSDMSLTICDTPAKKIAKRNHHVCSSPSVCPVLIPRERVITLAPLL